MTTPEDTTTQADTAPVATDPALEAHAEIERRFTTHAVGAEATAVIGALKEEFKHLGHQLVEHLPAGATREAALSHLEAASWHAVAAVARAEV